MTDLLDDILPVEPHHDAEVERLSAEVHALYQTEIRRQGREERHNDDYFSLPDHVKELDRVFVRWHLARLREPTSSSPNGTRGAYKHVCAGCGREFESNRRQLPGKRVWCGRAECKKIAASDRARDYRDRKTKEEKP